MRRHLAYYVHHHGQGHLSRAQAIVPHLGIPATVLTSADVDPCDLAPARTVRLPLDTGETETDHQLPVPRHMHHAPIGMRGLRERTAALTAFLAEVAPAVLVVDVSAEVAQLGRHGGIPTVVVRQHGDRWDDAHLAAYDGAAGLLAPFGPELEQPDVPPEVKSKTFYTGGFSRLSLELPSRDDARARLGVPRDRTLVVVLSGRGGTGPDRRQLETAARATPGADWMLVGDLEDDVAGVVVTGFVADPIDHLVAADVVVGSTGHNTVMEVATVGRPFVAIPQSRPFGEQHHKAQLLAALDVAEVSDAWPSPRGWPKVLRRAAARGSAMSALVTGGDGAARAARWLSTLAERYA